MLADPRAEVSCSFAVRSEPSNLTRATPGQSAVRRPCQLGSPTFSSGTASRPLIHVLQLRILPPPDFTGAPGRSSGAKAPPGPRPTPLHLDPAPVRCRQGGQHTPCRPAGISSRVLASRPQHRGCLPPAAPANLAVLRRQHPRAAPCMCVALVGFGPGCRACFTLIQGGFFFRLSPGML